MSLKSFITESIGILRSNSGPECAMAVDQIEQSVTKEFARLERYARFGVRMMMFGETLRHRGMLAKCELCYRATRNNEGHIIHAHDCDAAHILGPER